MTSVLHPVSLREYRVSRHEVTRATLLSLSLTLTVTRDCSSQGDGVIIVALYNDVCLSCPSPRDTLAVRRKKERERGQSWRVIHLHRTFLHKVIQDVSLVHLLL